MSSRSSAVVAADDKRLPLTAWFSVHARPEPGVMLRVLELFAKRGLVPQHCLGTASETALTIEVQIGGLDRDLVDYIARCMRQITGVEVVLTAEISAEG
jgi:acetolactate synthase small subunit